MLRTYSFLSVKPPKTDKKTEKFYRKTLKLSVSRIEYPTKHDKTLQEPTMKTDNVNTFTDKGIEITFHPEKEDEEKLAPVGYGDLIKLGEDMNYFYLFPNSTGGYCVPKAELGENAKCFSQFIEQKTEKKFYWRRATPLQRLRDWLRARNSEPEHL